MSDLTAITCFFINVCHPFSSSSSLPSSISSSLQPSPRPRPYSPFSSLVPFLSLACILGSALASPSIVAFRVGIVLSLYIAALVFHHRLCLSRSLSPVLALHFSLFLSISTEPFSSAASIWTDTPPIRLTPPDLHHHTTTTHHHHHGIKIIPLHGRPQQGCSRAVRLSARQP